jgi:hypothetical protein
MMNYSEPKPLRSFVFSSADMFLGGLFLLYVVGVVSKKVLMFPDGFQDIVVLMYIVLGVLSRGNRLPSAIQKLSKEAVFKLFILLVVYYFLLTFYYEVDYSLAIMEFFSVFKWIVYFFSGYLLGATFSMKSVDFHRSKLFLLFVLGVSLYSLATYNWSGFSISLVSIYNNSYSSLFSLRSVFALFGLIVFVIGINALDHKRASAFLLMGAAVMFLVMSGNRKMIFATLVIIAAIATSRKSSALVVAVIVLAISLALIAIFQSDILQVTIAEYSSENQPRVRTYLVALDLARDYFPFGSGPNSFASRGSMLNYSEIYRTYNLDQVWGFHEDDDTHFYNDTYWAQIVGQYGVLGVVLVLTVVWRMFKSVSGSGFRVEHQILLLVVVVLSTVTPSLQRIEISLFVFFSFGVFAQAKSSESLVLVAKNMSKRVLWKT